MASQPEVTVIIPNYNGKKLLENCIQTLERQTCTDFKLLVVDNGSDDGSTEVTSSLDLTMLALKENTGFCGAVNEGIRRADTPYVILLNNDTEVLPEFVEELLAAIKKSDRIFSAGAMMIDYHDRGRIDNAGDYYTAFGWAVARGKGKPLADFNRPCRVFSCCGGAVIYRTGLLREMGPFDERHFAYLEDVDMGYRAKIHGYINCYAPGHLGDAFHLNHKGHSALISCPLCLRQFVQVPHTALGGCIREIADTVHFQCAALDFQQILLLALFHIKVDAGLPIGEFRLDIVVALFCKPLPYHLVGCLTVHIDPAKTLLVYRHKVVFCFAFRVV